MVKKAKKTLLFLFLMALAVSMLCVPAFALTEAEVEAQVAATSKAEVSGNVLIWFLCAIAFLKVSQKVDSLMASLGVNVGHTGGSLLAEAMIAMRGVTMVAGAGGGRRSRISSGGSAGGTSGNSGWFMKGGLAGVVSRKINSSAVKTATTQTSAVRTAQSTMRQTTVSAQSAVGSTISSNSSVHTGGANVHTNVTAPIGTAPQDGMIVSGGGPQMFQTEGVPSQESMTSAGGETQMPQTDNVPPIVSPADSASPQEGVIVTGGEAPLHVPLGEGAVPATSQPDYTAPQDGVIMAGDVPPLQAAPQVEGIQADSSQTDSIPQHDGTILTDSGTSAHAPQTENTPQNGSGSTTQQNVTVNGGVNRVETHTERTTAHTAASSRHVQTSHSHTAGSVRPSLGGMIFSKSLAAGGSFANDVIGTVARGEVAGSITGDMAAQSLTSYMGYTALGEGARTAPTYSEVEIGRGRITGIETAAGSKEGMAFAMYHVDQYTAPSGEYSKVFSADGTQWYKQYAQDAVERKPYMAPDDTVAYHERIIKKLPDAPKRKDRI